MPKRRKPKHPYRIDDESAGWRETEHWVAICIVLLFCFGAALTALALSLIPKQPSTSDRVVSGLIGSLAGALVGASIGLVVNRRLNTTALERVRQVLARTTRSTLASQDQDLRVLRREWHHYHRTLIDNVQVWRYCVFKFDNYDAVGSLTTSVSVLDITGAAEPHVYKVVGAVRGSRLIITQERVEREERPVVEVFPTATGTTAGGHRYVGVAIMESWDGPDVLTPAILSDIELHKVSDKGTVDKNEWGDLNKIFHDGFVKVRRLWR